MPAPNAFGVCFLEYSYPIAEQAFVRVDPTHWLLDVCTSVHPDYTRLKEVSLFLTQPNVLEPGMALGLYISIGGAEWQYRGFVSGEHPSEAMPLKWPPASPMTAIGPGVVQVGISLEPYGEVIQKEGTKVLGRQEYAKRVALDLYRFMESFSVGVAADQMVLPTNVLERWFQRFDDKFRRDPDFLLH